MDKQRIWIIDSAPLKLSVGKYVLKGIADLDEAREAHAVYKHGTQALREQLAKVDLSIQKAENLLQKQGKSVPKPSLFFSYMALPTKIMKDFRLNLEECYEDWIEEFGERRAWWIWRRQELGLICHYWFGVAIDALEKARNVIWKVGG